MNDRSGGIISYAPDSVGINGAVSAWSLTVLHVDDDPNDAELLRAATRKAEVAFRLHTVEDGEAAMAYLSGAGCYADRTLYPAPALVLLDLKMPRATGLEVLRWIRKQPAFAKIPVIVLSGSELHEDIRQAYTLGANSYLIKPLGFDALVSLVKSVHLIWLNQSSGPKT